MAQPFSDVEHAAVNAIRNYLHRYPNSADTLEGVVQWWLADDFPKEITAAALEHLLASGELERLSIGQQQVWRRARSA
ncbi:MAG: hypothetical protein RR376_26315 [Janthinobacterium sp.]